MADINTIPQEAITPASQTSTLPVPQIIEPAPSLIAAPAIRANIPNQVPVKVLENPAMRQDTNGLVSQNQQIMDVTTLKPVASVSDAQARLTEAQNALRNYQLSLEGGLINIMKKPIALEFQQGQQAALTRDASFVQSALSRTVDAYASQLQTLQQKEAQMKQARDYAAEYSIGKQFYKLPGSDLIYNTTTGEAVYTFDQYKAMGGKGDWSDVETVNPLERKTVLSLMTQYRDAGINPTDSLASAQQKVNKSPTYLKSVAVSRSSGETRSSGSVPASQKPIALSTAKKYNLPSGVTNGEFQEVYNFIQGQRKGGGAYTDKWGRAVEELRKNGYNPEDYDAVLWEAFHPEGLKGYQTHVLGQGTQKTNSNMDSAVKAWLGIS